jgi:hypothetical protein
MSLSRWSFFSKGLNEEEREYKEGEQHNNDNGEEVVFSVSEKEMVDVKDNNDNDNDNSGEQEVKTVVESSCNTGTAESTDILFENAYECYMRRVAATNDSDKNDSHKNDSNSHYKGLHTEVMSTMPVLFIEEFVPDFYKFSSKKSVSVTDWRAYVYYDLYRGVYVFNGTRRRNNEHGLGTERKYPDIRMTFKSKSSLAFYLRRSMCSWKHKLSITMYSMYRSVIHLSTYGAMPSFHSIHHCRNKFRTELFGYDDCRVSLREFESYLKVLKDGADDGFLFRPTTTAK